MLTTTQVKDILDALGCICRPYADASTWGLQVVSVVVCGSPHGMAADIVASIEDTRTRNDMAVLFRWAKLVIIDEEQLLYFPSLKWDGESEETTDERLLPA